MIPDMTGKTIEIIRFNYSLAIWTSDNWQLDLAGITHVTVEGRSPVEIDTTLCQDELTDEVRPLLGQTITGAEVSSAGNLTITLNQTLLQVEAGDDHEAWQIYGPSGEIIVCMPGGELAIWGPRRN